MEKEFVPYDLALRMKSLGFDKPCFKYENVNERQLNSSEYEWFKSDNQDVSVFIKIPTYSQAFRFFREDYELFHKIDPSVSRDISYSIYSNDEEMYEDSCYWGYEEAELSCLIKLIEIVENN